MGKHGKSQRQKGDRVERGIVKLHLDMGVHAERVPLSGATGYQGNSADIDVYCPRLAPGPLCCEVKARKGGQGFVTLESWLSDNDVLFLKRDKAEPLVVLPWATWERLLK